MASSVTRSSRRAEGVHDAKQQQQPQRGHGDDEGGGARGKRVLDATERDLRPKKTRIAVDMRRQLPDEALAGAGLTKHQTKVMHGVKHELDRLQEPPEQLPEQAPAAKEQGRKLRSQEATRFKSELSAYFADYDEIIGNDPKESHVLNVDTPIVVVDTKNECNATNPYSTGPAPPTSTAIRGYGDALFSDIFDAQGIDFGFLETQPSSFNTEDPLPDAMFEAIHKRAERVERSIRNTEKGRAQHERDQIIRLLHGLQGHDWLRIMGVSGVTETKKKTFEPARAHFIRECQTILDKFRNWSEQEKRRKQKRDRTLAEQAAEERRMQEALGGGSEGEQVGGEGPATRGASEETATRMTGPSAAVLRDDEYSETPSPAQQLRQEAMSRPRGAGKRPRACTRAATAAATGAATNAEREFRSFFAKRYERDNALNRQRRTGRKVLAWGQPVPEMGEEDFDLPDEYRDEETMRLRERRKRRDKRSKRQ